MIRWLALLLVFLVLPAPKAAVPSTHASPALASWVSGVAGGASGDWAVVACDDTDDDSDSVPPAPERSDEDLFTNANAALAIPPSDALVAARRFHDTGLRPARGHFRAPELPPRSA